MNVSHLSDLAHFINMDRDDLDQFYSWVELTRSRHIKERGCLALRLTFSKMGVVDFTKSLWSNPYRWSLVKSLMLFGLAIYIAREMEAVETEAVAETAAQLINQAA